MQRLTQTVLKLSPTTNFFLIPESAGTGLQKHTPRAALRVKALLFPFIKHSDGYIWPILDDLVETGIDALNQIEPTSGMDIGK